MTSTTLPTGTGVVSNYTYDNADRLTAVSHVKGGTALASAAYTAERLARGLESLFLTTCFDNRPMYACEHLLRLPADEAVRRGERGQALRKSLVSALERLRAVVDGDAAEDVTEALATIAIT